MRALTTLLALCLVACRAHDLAGNPDEEDQKDVEYGVDVSYPIHHGLEPGTFQWERWHREMNLCARRYSKGSCEANERSRMQLNRVQPPLQVNYTNVGYAKLRAPEASFKRLKEFWNQFRNKEQEEAWPAGNTYTNHWSVPTYMVSLEDQRLRGGLALKQQIWNEVGAILEEWTGQKLKQTSLYGIRVYKEGAVLASHVDRLPLVTSAIINVDQDIDEPWPVEVYNHDGQAHNVTMEPGDIVLYESHTVVHGRPAPLKGRFFANVFVHFMPVHHEGHGDSSEFASNRKYSEKVKGFEEPKDSKSWFGFGKKEPARPIAGHEQHETVEEDHHDEPPKLISKDPPPKKAKPEDKPDEEGGEGPTEERETDGPSTDDDDADDANSSPLHIAAGTGDLDTVKDLLESGHDVLTQDKNYWHPLHEASRGGHVEIVKHLVEHGADLGATTKGGGTALWWARQVHDADHPVITFLESIGAPDWADEEL